MRTNQDYIDFYSNLVDALELKITNKEAYCTGAVTSGLSMFWGAHNWSFKRKFASLVVSDAESFDLPDDFDSMVGIREQSTNMGLRLRFMSKEEFDLYVPKQSAYSSDNPQIYTIYTVASGKKKISFWPKPTSQTLEYLYNRTTPDNTSEVPDKFQSGVNACISFCFYPQTFYQRNKSYGEARAEIKRLQIEDKDNYANPVTFTESNRFTITPISPWR